MKLFKMLTIVCFGLFLGTVILAEENYYEKGIYYREQGDEQKAAECFRKVLYRERYNVRASLQLAEIYEKAGQYSKAESEYSLVKKHLHRDTEITPEARELFRIQAEEKLKELALAKKVFYATHRGKIPPSVVLVTCTGILIAGGYLLCFCVRFIRCVGRMKEHMRQKRIWRDCYWERREEKEVRTFLWYVFVVAVHSAGVLMIILSISNIRAYGANEFISSLRTLFMYAP